MLSTSANAAIPAFRKRPACDEAGATGHAAGVLFLAPDGDVLLLRRSSQEANYAGHWALPGGGVDEGESPEEGAVRECEEEIDNRPAGLMKLLDQRRTPNGKVFHTFAAPTEKKFVPRLNDEHSGYAWAPLDQLPQPLHPAVAATLKERIGSAQDMTPEDWTGLRDGFLKWTVEEEDEDEHVATDSALLLALDRESVREKSPEGHLHVALTNISKATVNPYRGEEIPNYEALGLDPQGVYHLLRDPEELRKAAASFNGKPLLRKHKPTSAAEHAGDVTIGATGTDAVFEDPYLKNSLVVWPQEDIDAIESEIKKELSSGYRYRAEMTPGIFRGMPYDGVMRDIVGNHVALVKDGRAGPDVVVGDSMENLMSKPTRLAALTLGLTAASIAPLLAKDSALVLPKDLFASITSKNITAKKPELLAGVKTALAASKFRPGMALDASMEHVGKVMDTVAGLFGEKGADESVSEEQHKAMEAAANGKSDLGIPQSVGEEYAEADKGKGFDAEPLKAFLKEKGMGEDDIAKVCDMLPKPALDAEEEEAEKDNDTDGAVENAHDAEELKKKLEAKDAEMKDMVKKPAMDEAIKAAVKGARETERGIRLALDKVRPWVGELSPALAMDSADDVYRHAAKAMGIAGADTIHASALPTLIEMQPKPGARQTQKANGLALDETSRSEASKIAPGIDRITVGA